MKLFDETVQIRPADNKDMYTFLLKISQEWMFLSRAQALDMVQVSDNEMSALTDTRNRAIDMFNERILRLFGHEWFNVLHRQQITENTYDETHDVVLTAGESILVKHTCQCVLAHVSTEEKTITDPKTGEDITLFEKEEINLQCSLAPPRDDELRVLPISIVPYVQIFEH